MRWRRQLSIVLAGCVLSVIGAAGFGGAAPAYAIANGEDVDDGDYPFSVKLSMFDLPEKGGGTRDSSCSGSLVNSRWVLTAGHCFRDKNLKRVARPVAKRTVATVGRADLTGSAGQEAKVIAVKQSSVADVALAKLDHDIKDITPAKLNRGKPRLGLRVRLIGFGLVNGDESDTTDRMQTGQFTVTSVDRYLLGMTGKSPKSTTSPCPHDSGGPYFTKDKSGVAVVVGVVSGGPTCPHTGADRSGRIDTVAPWILGIIGRDGPLPKPKPSKPPAVAKAPSAKPSARPLSSPVSEELPYGLSLPVVVGGSLAAVIAVFLIVTARSRRGRGRKRFRHRRIR
ncbi:S1 family peptidase [Actinoplanes sp. NPDC049265]|uniref:S1 family peptidase n=1 Tax=Actinoplanes sp. NPDC049265 TaxID=3363902 RepID=UPI003720EC70